MILIVDDHPDSCDVLRRLLVLSGHRDVACVYSGEDALDYVRSSHKPTVMVLDYMMPGMTGLDVLRELRAHPEFGDVAVVFYSADVTGRAASAARMLGAKAWMTKGGVAWPDLLDTIGAMEAGTHA
ncbi:MAG: hypothetical protein JWO31_2621 [Phycisphaerales bacterium]|nr:hypothetical protein [Phycisphaerales bacterium]